MLNYSGLHAVRERLLVSEKQVNEQIDRLLEQNPKLIPVTQRPARLDDELVLDYAGECDGEYFAGGTAQRQTLTLGSGMFIPGFEEQLVGVRPGDEVDVRVTFPTPYHTPELAGREAVFHCKVHEIRVRSSYAPNDEFAREVGGCENMEALRRAIRTQLQAYIDGQAEEQLRGDLIDQVCEGMEFDISPRQLELALDQEMKLLEAQLTRLNLSMEQYSAFMNRSVEQLREDQRPVARRNIERQLAMDAIAEQEHIEPDEASVIDALQAICRDNGLTMEQLEPQLDAAFQSAVERSVVNRKVLDRLVELADISEIVKEKD